MSEKKIEKAPIDFVEIGKKLWNHRKTYYKVLPATLIITYLITVCIPRYYTCTVSLAPEPTGSSMSGSLGSLASSFGLGGLGKIGNNDALYVEIYPNILKSTDFIAELMTTEIKTKRGDVKANYYTYLKQHQKMAWWDVVKEIIVSWFTPTPPADTYTGKETISVFNLTKEQSDIFNSVTSKITGSVDKKTEVVSITVKDQDPLVCATMANTTCKKLQDFIVKYRTNKARIDYEHYKKLCTEAKQNYERARQRYAAMSDANEDVMLQSVKSKIEDLENEMQLKYNIYTAMNTQLQMAQAKLQEATPAFTVIQSASVPVKPAGPKRVLISLGMMVLVFIVMSGYYLIREQQPC